MNLRRYQKFLFLALILLGSARMTMPAIMPIPAMPEIYLWQQTPYHGWQKFPLPPLLWESAHTSSRLASIDFQHPFFDTHVLRDPVRARRLMIKEIRSTHQGVVHHIPCYREKLTTAAVTFFDRGSDILLVCGPGFGCARESLLLLAALFDRYDVVLCDSAGHGIDALYRHNFYTPRGIGERITKKMFGVNPLTCTSGVEEHLDIAAIVRHFKRQKPYKTVCGLGFCYSGLIFLKAAASGVFDKLIVDSIVPGLPEVFGRLQKNPSLMKFLGVRSNFLNWSWLSSLHTSIIALARSLFVGNIKNHLVASQAIAAVKIPLLYVHESGDPLVSEADFEQHMRAITHVNGAAISVRYAKQHHLVNHLKIKELYKYLAELFIEQGVAAVTLWHQ